MAASSRQVRIRCRDFEPSNPLHRFRRPDAEQADSAHLHVAAGSPPSGESLSHVSNCGKESDGSRDLSTLRQADQHVWRAGTTPASGRCALWIACSEIRSSAAARAREVGIASGDVASRRYSSRSSGHVFELSSAGSHPCGPCITGPARSSIFRAAASAPASHHGCTATATEISGNDQVSQRGSLQTVDRHHRRPVQGLRGSRHDKGRPVYGRDQFGAAVLHLRLWRAAGHRCL
jgi:hypothetical protein